MKTLTRRSLLAGSAAALAAGGLGVWRSGQAASLAGTPRKLILVVAQGGWDVTYALDPKPGIIGIDAPDGTVENFSGIPILTDPARPAVGEFFSANAGLCSVINGLQVRSVSHSNCAARVLTGTVSETSPDVGAIVAHTHGRSLPVPYLVLGRMAFSGPHAALTARTGTTNQLDALLNQSSVLWFASTPQQSFTPSTNEEALIRAHVNVRAERELATRGQAGSNQKHLQDFLDSLSRGDALRNSPGLGAFNLTRDLGPQVEIAIAALSQGLSQAVQIEAGDFDTHIDNSEQNNLHDSFFAGLNLLVERLATTNGTGTGSKLLDETVVVVVSELGRTPKLNGDGGKDHWGTTSAMVFGAGVKGGQVVGATNDGLEGELVDLASGQLNSDGLPLDYGAFAAGVLSLTGVDPSELLPRETPLGGLSV